ncbi:RNA polymerase sigma-70 factor [Dysgonomonas sp. Marseille-P4677]|uniref:RNA polymerase sigma-70 factor n=1 Tax=Dysgonomonas sp. Marseille-P4677 TaxID=2364790 RepID=UPI0019138BAE|nr:RNA polymerase sigma-70 factor [Dysgonomonas sp. Marseille-P4677]MBK5721880.1 RNA polymerase sigma-70 factor [Dysgonomonas sp. Marseille-P4677]
MDNEELVAAIIRGSEDAFKIIFNNYYQGLVRFAFSYTNDIHIAENIVQESFILLWQKHEEIDEDSNIQAFLIRIVKLKVWNHIEKQRRRIIIQKGIYDDIVREMNLKLYTLDTINTTSLYIDEIKQIIARTLEELPELTRNIFTLSREEYLSNKQIAEKINLSEKSVEYHISNTLKRLRISLSSYLKSIILFNL